MWDYLDGTTHDEKQACRAHECVPSLKGRGRGGFLMQIKVSGHVGIF
jgi:hypothetical protein